MHRDYLDILEVTLLGQAAPYDLREKAERTRSVRNLEKLFFRICREVCPSVFIEAGAKDGATSRRARRYLPNSRIVAFEGNPETFKRFRDDTLFEEQKVEYLHLALSESPGHVTFHIRKSEDGGKSADGQGSILVPVEGETIPVDVESVRLDRFFSEDSFCAWVDVEGASKEVLTGAEGILNRTAAVFIEVETRAKWKGQWLAADVTSFLCEHGLIPVARDFQSRYQHNLVFIQRGLLRHPRINLFLAEHLMGST